VTRFALLVLLVLALSAGAAAARDGGDQDVRVAGDCTRGTTSSLRVRAEDKGIEVRFRLRETRGRGVWRITVVHENRVSARVKRTTTRSDDSLELRRILPDFPGSDTIAVRAWGPRGFGCRAAARLGT
jgi:hypothetical protein